ncbi:SAV_2336 N-terminal domain-related protein [Streptomyces sp. NPDC012474]|uniref:SAV_2336 N-terminal domain-related protein n=1 Tax=Streptomyces sp. NPDC012474 TaxID=3364836 RepID=UPI0036E3A371
MPGDAGGSELRFALDVLADCGVGLSQEELLDALWLARRLTGSPDALPLQRDATHRAGARPAPPVPDRRRPRETPGSKASLFGGSRTRPRPEPETAPSAPEPETAQPAVTPQAEEKRAMPLRVPEAKALTDELSIGRVLRPLKQSRPSSSRYHFDEEATVHALAETGLPDVVLRPAPERWLDLALVVDDGMSMLLWQRLATELHALLRRAGAFRVIRTYGLHTRGDEVYLRGRPFSDEANRMPTHLVADPTGRTLVLLVSDGVGRAWRDGRMHSTLSGWARCGPTAVVHALPPRMWGGSALRAQRWQVTSGRRGSANAEWTVTDPVLPPDVMAFRGVPVPVLEPAPAALSAWVRLVAAPAASTTLPLLAAPRSGPSRPVDTGLPRLRRFHSAATPEAYRLAAHLAGVAPLSLPVMRLVQAAIPWADTPHLAEVFLGGLLRPLPVPPGECLPPQHQLFDFDSDIGDVLLNAVPLADVVETGRTVSARLEQLAGRSPDFPAWLAHPEGKERIPSSTRAFAAIGPRLAARFGVGSLERRMGSIWRPLRSGDPWRIGPYTVHARGLGDGPCQKFLGRDPGGTEVVVVTAERRFEGFLSTEARALRRLAGRYAPRLIASDLDATQPWVAEVPPHSPDGIPAEPLAAVLDREGLEPDAALELAWHLCEAVETSHRADLVHGSIDVRTVRCLGRSVLLTDWFWSSHASERVLHAQDMVALAQLVTALIAFAPEADLDELRVLLEECDARLPGGPTAGQLGEVLSARLGMQGDDGKLVEAMDGPARAELIRTQIRSCRKIAVLGMPGAIGKSTTAALLATVFATERRGRTVVVDADPGRGTLGFRVNQNRGKGMSALVRVLDRVNGRRDLAPYLSTMESGADVLTDLVGLPTPPAPQQVRRVCDTLARHFKVLITDSHTTEFDEGKRVVLSQSDQLVLVVDSLSHLLSGAHLEYFNRLLGLGYKELLARSVIVVSTPQPPGRGPRGPHGIIERDADLRHLCRGIVAIPYSSYLADTGEARLGRLDVALREIYYDLAALVAQSFTS